MNYRLRRDRARRLMVERQLDRLILTEPGDIRYLGGITVPGAGLILSPDETLLLIPAGRETELADLPRALRVEVFRGDRIVELRRRLRELEPRRIQLETSPLARESNAAPIGADGIGWRTGSMLAGLRAVKDATELAALRRAQEIADRAFDEAIAGIEPGITERWLARRLEDLAASAGAEEIPFPTMVAFGPGTGQAHGAPTDRKLGPGDPVQIDLGVRWGGYCTDTSRFLCFGSASPMVSRLYRAVVEAKEAVLRRALPGIPVEDLHRVADQVLRDAGFGEYFQHCLGHGIGLEVHEPPFVRMGNRLALEPDMVLSVEPGICVAGRYGVRIESLIRIGSDPAEELSHLAWRSLQILPA